MGRNDDIESSRPLAEVLEYAYRRGRALRVRKLLMQVLSAVSTVALFSAGSVYVLNASKERPKEPTVVASSPSPEEHSPTPTASDSTEPTVTPPAEPSPSPSKLVCRNSTNPDCGRFYWDPEPENQPLTIHVTFSPASPRVGEEVVFHVTAEDPDAPIDRMRGGGGYDVNFEAWSPKREALPYLHEDGSCDTVGYGPWEPPEKKPGRMELTLEHRYEKAGTYDALFAFQSHNPGPFKLCGDGNDAYEDAYGNYRFAAISVTVSE